MEDLSIFRSDSAQGKKYNIMNEELSVLTDSEAEPENAPMPALSMESEEPHLSREFLDFMNNAQEHTTIEEMLAPPTRQDEIDEEGTTPLSSASSVIQSAASLSPALESGEDCFLDDFLPQAQKDSSPKRTRYCTAPPIDLGKLMSQTDSTKPCTFTKFGSASLTNETAKGEITSLTTSVNSVKTSTGISLFTLPVVENGRPRKLPVKPLSSPNSSADEIDLLQNSATQRIENMASTSLTSGVENLVFNSQSGHRRPRKVATAANSAKVRRRSSNGVSDGKRDGECYLKISVQPEKRHRARYRTEGSRGAVKDELQSGHPVVELIGYNEVATLEVFIADDSDKIRPHEFYQACQVTGKNCTPCEEKKENDTVIICMELNPEKGMKAIINCVGILKLRNADVEKAKLRSTKKSTQCRMAFRVCLKMADGEFKILRTASHVISCTQPPGTPEISKKSLSSASAEGGQEMFVIGKNFTKGPGTKAVFQEVDSSGTIIWQKEGDIDPEYSNPTHFVCVVPPYPTCVKPVTVQFLVDCGGQGRMSDPVNFCYEPAVTDVPMSAPTAAQEQGRPAKEPKLDLAPSNSSSMAAPEAALLAERLKQQSNQEGPFQIPDGIGMLCQGERSCQDVPMQLSGTRQSINLQIRRESDPMQILGDNNIGDLQMPPMTSGQLSKDAQEMQEVSNSHNLLSSVQHRQPMDMAEPRQEMQTQRQELTLLQNQPEAQQQQQQFSPRIQAAMPLSRDVQQMLHIPQNTQQMLQNPQDTQQNSQDPQQMLCASQDTQQMLHTPQDTQRMLQNSQDPQQMLHTSQDTQQMLRTSQDTQQMLHTPQDTQRMLQNPQDAQQMLRTSQEPQQIFCTLQNDCKNSVNGLSLQPLQLLQVLPDANPATQNQSSQLGQHLQMQNPAPVSQVMQPNEQLQMAQLSQVLQQSPQQNMARVNLSGQNSSDVCSFTTGLEPRAPEQPGLISSTGSLSQNNVHLQNSRPVSTSNDDLSKISDMIVSQELASLQKQPVFSSGNTMQNLMAPILSQGEENVSFNTELLMQGGGFQNGSNQSMGRTAQPMDTSQSMPVINNTNTNHQANQLAQPSTQHVNLTLGMVKVEPAHAFRNGNGNIMQLGSCKEPQLLSLNTNPVVQHLQNDPKPLNVGNVVMPQDNEHMMASRSMEQDLPLVNRNLQSIQPILTSGPNVSGSYHAGAPCISKAQVNHAAPQVVFSAQYNQTGAAGKPQIPNSGTILIDTSSTEINSSQFQNTQLLDSFTGNNGHLLNHSQQHHQQQHHQQQQHQQLQQQQQHRQQQNMAIVDQGTPVTCGIPLQASITTRPSSITVAANDSLQTAVHLDSSLQANNSTSYGGPLLSSVARIPVVQPSLLQQSSVATHQSQSRLIQQQNTVPTRTQPSLNVISQSHSESGGFSLSQLQSPQLQSPQQTHLQSPQQGQFQLSVQGQLQSPIRGQLQSPIRDQLQSPIRGQLQMRSQETYQTPPNTGGATVSTSVSSLLSQMPNLQQALEAAGPGIPQQGESAPFQQ